MTEKATKNSVLVTKNVLFSEKKVGIGDSNAPSLFAEQLQ